MYVCNVFVAQEYRCVGVQECIMVRSIKAGHTHSAPGYTIYGKPKGGGGGGH